MMSANGHGSKPEGLYIPGYGLVEGRLFAAVLIGPGGEIMALVPVPEPSEDGRS